LEQLPLSSCTHLFLKCGKCDYIPRISLIALCTTQLRHNGMCCGVHAVERLIPLGLGFVHVECNGFPVTFTGHMVLTAKLFHDTVIQWNW